MSKKNFLRLPSWLRSSRFYRGRISRDSSTEFCKEPITECHPHDANLISSRRHDGRHNILLDLDTPHFYVESSTPGKGHLYIESAIESQEFEALLTLLNSYSVIEKGYLEAFQKRGHATLRLPGIKKGNYEDERWFYDELEPSESSKENWCGPLSPIAVLNAGQNGPAITDDELKQQFGEAVAAKISEAIKLGFYPDEEVEEAEQPKYSDIAGQTAKVDLDWVIEDENGNIVDGLCTDQAFQQSLLDEILESIFNKKEEGETND